MPAARHTPRRALAPVAGAALLLAAVALGHGSLALELAPGILLVALAGLGWMPGEERLVRAMRARRAGPRARRRPATARPRPRDAALPGRRFASSVPVRGPPGALAA